MIAPWLRDKSVFNCERKDSSEPVSVARSKPRLKVSGPAVAVSGPAVAVSGPAVAVSGPAVAVMQMRVLS